MTPMTPLEQEIWDAVQALNRTWTLGEVAELQQFLHPEMVAITPQDSHRLSGREAYFHARERFARSARVHGFTPVSPAIRVFGDTAIVTYYYEMTFDADDGGHTERGRDMLVMLRQDGRWIAVANQFSNFPT